MTDLFATPHFQNYSIPLIKSDENHINSSLLKDELMYQFDEEIENLQLYPMSNNYNYKYSTNTNVINDNYTFNENINISNQVDYHDILGIAIDGTINLKNKNNQIPVDISQQQNNNTNQFDLDTYYYHQYLNNNNNNNNKPVGTDNHTTTNKYNNPQFPNNIPYLSSDDEGDNTYYSDVIHTVPLKSKKQNQILKTKCIYEEFLKDYDSVSTMSTDSNSTQINNNDSPKKEKHIYDFPITEMTNTSKHDQYIASTFPRLIPDTFQSIATSENKYIPNTQIIETNQDHLHRNSITDDISDDTNHQNSNNLYPCIDKHNNTTSEYEEFNNKLQKKLNRYFSNADYLDKVRFQEISYRFSRTYY